MKKHAAWLLGLACSLTLFACGKKAEPIVVPDPAEVRAITVTSGDAAREHSDKTWVADAISGMAGAAPTGRESVQDVPGVEDYLKIDMKFDKGASTLFAYADDGKYYFEQPYQGIYEIDKSLYEKLRETA